MKIQETIRNFSKVFHTHGYQLFLVGGALRDNLLGGQNTDYDFATDARPEEVMKMFRSVVPVGIAHGTVLVLFEGDEYEVTTFRTESTYSDNRRPDEVTFVPTIDEDLKRRDFTINAFAYDVIHNTFIDNFDGKKDIAEGIIRAIGNPGERFDEDALRMLRACRFACKLNFTIEEATLEAMTERADLIKKISSERVRDELIKIMKSPKPSIGIEYMRECGLLKHILPELLEGYKVDQNRFHKFDVYHHNLFSCDAAPADNVIVRFAALFHDIAKPRTRRAKEDDENSFYNHEIIGGRMAYRILKGLKFSNEQINRITHLIKHHMFYYTHEWTDGAVRRFIRKVGLEHMADLFLLRDADRAGNGTKQGIPKAFLDFKDKIEEILEKDNALKVTDLEINGNLLMENLKLKPGPIIGEILNYLLELVLDNPELNTFEQLLEKAGEYYEKKEKYALEEYGKKPEELGKF